MTWKFHARLILEHLMDSCAPHRTVRIGMYVSASIGHRQSLAPVTFPAAVAFAPLIPASINKPIPSRLTSFTCNVIHVLFQVFRIGQLHCEPIPDLTPEPMFFSRHRQQEAPSVRQQQSHNLDALGQ